MTSSRRFLAGLVACACLIASCGDDKNAPPKSGATASGGGGAAAGGGGAAAGSGAPAVVRTQPDPPSGMLDLTPAGTIGVVYVANAKTLEDGINRIAAAGGEKKAVDLSQFAGMIGADIADFDLGRPAAMAMAMAADSPEPKATMILPVRDEKASAAKLKATGATVETSSGFAAVTPEGEYKRSGLPASMKSPLPAGDLVLRLDVATVWKSLGPMAMANAEEMVENLNAMSGGAAPQGAALKPMLDGMKANLDAASLLDLAFRIDGTAVEIDGTLRFAEGKKPPILDLFKKTDLQALARCIPDDGMMLMAANVDQAAAMAWFEPFMKSSLEIYPEADRAKIAKSFEAMTGAFKQLGSGLVMSMSFGANGMELVGIVETKDGAAYAKAMMDATSDMEAAGGAVTRGKPEERTVEGVKVTTYKLTFDAAKLSAANPDLPGDPKAALEAVWGKDGMRVSIADLGGRTVTAIGPTDDRLAKVIKASKAGSTAPTPLATALANAGGDTVAYAKVDVAGVLSAVSAVMGKGAAAKPAGEPIPITFIMNAGPAYFRGRASADVGKIAKAVQALSGEQPR